MMRLWSRVRFRRVGVNTPRRSSGSVSGLRAGDAEIRDFVADGAWSWHSPRGDAFHPVDPYLLELGWRAWCCMVEENVLGRLGFPDTLVEFLETGV
jgi:hypothetical protein